MKRVLLPVGLPGSGKSTEVQKLVKKASQEGKLALVCSTDDFFVNAQGVYDFNPRKLTENHALNFQKFCLALADGIELVVVDNTNLRAEHRAPYIKMAKALGYKVELPIIGEFTDSAAETYAKRNLHGVPLEGIKRMANAVDLPTSEEIG